MSDPAAPEEPAGISMILPVHNRADQLGPAAERWAAALEALGRPYEILAVDDGSTDATAEVLAKLAEQYPHLRVLRHEQRRGFGAALRTAIPEARFPLLFYTSLDYPYEPQDLARLLARLEEKDPETGLRLHLVTGFRTGRDAPPLPRLFGKLWRGFWNLLLDLGLTPPPGWLGTRAKIYAWANRMLFGLRVLDVNSAFKLFRKSIFPRIPIQSDGEFVHAEILAKANFLGCYMDEVPLTPPSPRPDTDPGPVSLRDFRAVFSRPDFGPVNAPGFSLSTSPAAPGEPPRVEPTPAPEPSPRSDAVTPTIDAHQHFWQTNHPAFDYSWLKAEKLAPINRDFLPQDLKPLIDAAGIRRTVFVQTQHTVEENRWALKLAGENDWIAGVVGWVDLAGEKCEEQLLEFKDHPKFVGVRHITQDEPDDDFIVREDVLRGLKVLEKHGVPFDLLFYVKHLRHAATLAEKLPDLPMVIDHLSKPEIKLRRTDNWIDHLRAAARHPNVYCKLSGMITEADWQNWKPADLKPYVQAALECFGPDRCMFGSDWPVCLLAGSYQQVLDALDEALGPISAEERAKIFGGTAIRFYKLQG